jgi:phosphoribosylformimino-5-aminoimidazole carboxamide ribotide isomerase
MLLILPEINIKDGCCCSEILGEPGTEGNYSQLSKDPSLFCSFLRRENAKSLVVNDINSLENGDNDTNRDTILHIVESVDIPVNVYADFTSLDQFRFLLDNGIHRVIIGKLSMISPDEIKRFIAENGSSRIVFKGIAHNRKIVFGDCEGCDDIKFLEHIQGLGANRVIYGDINWTTGDEEDIISTLTDLASKSNLRITLANGVYNPRQLWRINELPLVQVDSVIIGQPLYENSFPCQKIWRMIEAEVEWKNND